MSWVRRGLIGLLILAVLVPGLVVAGAIADLTPRHWSGAQLVGVRADPFFPRTYPPPDAEGRTYTEDELYALRGRLMFADLPPGTFMVSTDRDRHQIIFSTSALSHSSFAFSRDRYGDAAAFSWNPMRGPASMDGSYSGPSFWNRTNPPATWFALATGFPAYLATGVVLTVAGWLLVSRRRRRRPQTDRRLRADGREAPLDAGAVGRK